MKEEFDNIIQSIVKSKLKNVGFNKTGTTFTKKESDFTIVLDIWKSSWNTSDQIMLWIEIGVFRNSFFKFIFHQDLQKKLRSNHCSIKTNAGALTNVELPNKNYTLTKSTVEKVSSELEEDLNKLIIPFISTLKSLEDLLIFERINPIKCTMTKLFVGLALAERNEKKISHFDKRIPY
jgi:hypothetical protein